MKFIIWSIILLTMMASFFNMSGLNKEDRSDIEQEESF